MPQNNPPVSLRERRAYHEAGYAATASRFEIHIHRVALPSDESPDHKSRFQPLAEFCRLNSSLPTSLAKVGEYIVFLLSGSVTEMVAVERLQGIVAGSDQQGAFRARWYAWAWSNPRPQLDLAYYCVAAWLPVRTTHEIANQLHAQWQRTIKLVQEPVHWSGAQRIAERLLAGESLDASAVAEAMATGRAR